MTQNQFWALFFAIMATWAMAMGTLLNEVASMFLMAFALMNAVNER